MVSSSKVGIECTPSVTIVEPGGRLTIPHPQGTRKRCPYYTTASRHMSVYSRGTPCGCPGSGGAPATVFSNQRLVGVSRLHCEVWYPEPPELLSCSSQLCP